MAEQTKDKNVAMMKKLLEAKQQKATQGKQAPAGPDSYRLGKKKSKKGDVFGQ